MMIQQHLAANCAVGNERTFLIDVFQVPSFCSLCVINQKKEPFVHAFNCIDDMAWVLCFCLFALIAKEQLIRHG